ncbi:MAG TPA: hypothetical protein VK034_05120 [Enhygromyxa sp.]|nr:hypothetical protein [Enhygromyxa sp.]
MIRKLTVALALASSLSLALLGACTPAPSKPEPGEQAAPEAKPEDVCKHVRELADKDSDDAAALDKTERECLETLVGLQTRYRTFTTCVELAVDQNAIYECEKGLTKPRSLLASVGPMAKVEALCNHVIEMLEQQLGGAAPQMQPGELEALRTQCMQDAGKQLEVQGPEAFAKEADCILAAKTIEELTACGL